MPSDNDLELPKSDDLMVSVSGVRGTVPAGLNPKTVLAWAAAFGEELRIGKKGTGGRPKVVVARDNRPTGQMLTHIVHGVLVAQGFRVYDLGVAPTPSVKAVVRYKKAAGGIMLSASHNPMNWNAFKFIGANGLFFTAEQIERVTRRMVHNEPAWRSYDAQGSIKESLSFRKHVKEVMEKCAYTNKVKKAQLRVAVDANCGATSEVLPTLLKKLNCKVHKINCKVAPRFPREPEPVAAALKELGHAVRKHDCDLGIAADPDGDRLAVVDETGKPIGEELTLPLAMLSALDDRTGDVVINLSTSMVCEYVAQKFDRKVHRSAVGEANVVEEMQRIKAAFGGEGNGGVIDPKVASFGRDSLAATMHILGTMVKMKKRLSRIVKKLPVYSMVKLKTTRDGWNEQKQKDVSLALEDAFGQAKVNTIDGFHWRWDSKWVHIRPSNTEPILRIMYECDPSETESVYKVLNTQFNLPEINKAIGA